MIEEYVTVPTRVCGICDKPGNVTVPASGIAAYQAGALLQNAFPRVDRAIREQYKTGIHPFTYI